MGRLNIARKNIAIKAAMPLVVLSSMGLSGCMQRVRNSPPEQMVLPVVADEAMQKRDWAQSSAIYPNGATAAGHTDYPFEPKPDQTWYLYAVADSWVFVFNTAILPFELIKDPPYQLTIHQGNTYPPSYNAMPVLPPSQTTEEVSYPGVPLIVPIPAASSSTKQTAMPGMVGSVPSHGTTSPTTSPTTHPTYHPLPTQPGAQPTGSPLVTPGRGQPTAPPITLPPATPTHPSTQPTYPSGQPGASIKPSGGTQSAYAPSTYSPSPKTSVTATPAPVVSSTPSASSQLTLTPKASTPAPTVAPQPSVTIAPTTRPANNDLESSSALDLSLAPSVPSGQTVETRIVGGKLTLVPTSQPTTKPTTSPVNWPPLNK